jgi:DNA-binding CsgD family transcriptional regulator
MSNPSVSLAAIAAGSVFRSDSQLVRLLQEADQVKGAMFGIVDFSNLAIAYAGNRVGEWLGVQASDLVAGGIRQMLAYVQPDQLQHLALIQAAYLQHARSTDFDPRSVRYLDLSWTAVTPKGSLPLISTMIALTFAPSRDLGWSVCFQVKDNDESLQHLVECRKLLRQIKERHNEIYVHAALEIPTRPGTIQTTHPVIEKVTPRELEVLVLIAKGYSTPDIATQLAIAANTVESHRKKLLEKFDARNVAELIKKASKVYWLE